MSLPRQYPKKRFKKGQRPFHSGVLGYLEFAAAVAKLTKRDPEEFKLRILKETRLWSRPVQDDDVDDPGAANLALLLRSMSERVIRTAKLPKLLSRARQIPGVWDVDFERFRPSEMACLFQQSYLDCFEHWTEAPPLPSVPLVRHAHADFVTEVRIERNAVDSPRDPASVQSEFEGDIAVASFALQREIRLALGPTMSTSCLGPMLETRAHVLLRLFAKDAPVELRRLLPSATLKPDDSLSGVPASVFQVQFEDGWHRVVPLQRLDGVEPCTERGNDPFTWATNPFDPESAVEHWYFSWIPVNEDTVRHCLDRPYGKSTEVCIPQSATGKEHLGAVWYSRPSAASYVEEALVNGTLERALTNSIEKISAALGQREAEWKEKARMQTANLLSRFRGESAE